MHRKTSSEANPVGAGLKVARENAALNPPAPSKVAALGSLSNCGWSFQGGGRKVQLFDHRFSISVAGEEACR